MSAMIINTGNQQQVASYTTLLERTSALRRGLESAARAPQTGAKGASTPPVAQTLGKALAPGQTSSAPIATDDCRPNFNLRAQEELRCAAPAAPASHQSTAAPACAESPARRGQGDEALWAASMSAIEDRQRQCRVQAFLQDHGFDGVNKACGWFRPRFPLHQAVELADARMVALLLKSGARRRVYDFTGLTPQQLARERNSILGSHDEVLKVFSDYGIQRAAEKKRRSAQKRAAVNAAGSVQQRCGPAIALCSLTDAYIPEACDHSARAPQVASASAQCDLGSETLGEATEASLEKERAARLAAEAEVSSLRAKLRALLAEEQDGAEGAGAGSAGVAAKPT